MWSPILCQENGDIGQTVALLLLLLLFLFYLQTIRNNYNPFVVFCDFSTTEICIWHYQLVGEILYFCQSISFPFFPFFSSENIITVVCSISVSFGNIYVYIIYMILSLTLTIINHDWCWYLSTFGKSCRSRFGSNALNGESYFLWNS